MDEQTFKNTFGFPAVDLSAAEVSGTELPTGSLEFDSENYIDFEEFVARLRDLPEKPGKKPSVKSLSVNGKVINDRMEKYLAARGESSSALKEAMKSPRHYLIYKNERLHPADESHFTLGTFIHSAFLEPRKFDKVRVLPQAPLNTVEGVVQHIKYYWDVLGEEQKQELSDLKMGQLKATLADLKGRAAELGYTFISAQDKEIVRVVQSSYKTYAGGIIPRLVKAGRCETSMYGTDRATGLKVKIRPDCMLLEEQVGANIILSVKTTSATSIDGFMRDAAKYRYDMAEGMYLQVASEITGRKFAGTIMLMAQTVIPFQCALLWLDAEDLQVGKYKYRQALDVVKTARETDRWPGFECYAEDGAFGLVKVKFPSWTKEELRPQDIPSED